MLVWWFILYNLSTFIFYNFVDWSNFLLSTIIFLTIIAIFLYFFIKVIVSKEISIWDAIKKIIVWFLLIWSLALIANNFSLKEYTNWKESWFVINLIDEWICWTEWDDCDWWKIIKESRNVLKHTLLWFDQEKF